MSHHHVYNIEKLAKIGARDPVYISPLMLYLRSLRLAGNPLEIAHPGCFARFKHKVNSELAVRPTTLAFILTEYKPFTRFSSIF